MSEGFDEDQRWKRDLPLLSVAGKAREARLDAAWRALADGPGQVQP